MAATSEALNMLKKGKVKQTKASSNALQKENIEVERKLNALKEKMRKEKEERERMGGPRWKSSQKANASSEKKVTKKQIKVLTDQPLEHYKQERKPPPPNTTVKQCGQCDDRKAKVECNECAECYCADCYKHFHSRGALRKHTWKSLEQAKLNAKYKQQLENITSKSAPTKRDASSSSVKQENTPTSTDYTRTKEMFTVSGLSVANVSPRSQQQHQQTHGTSTTRHSNTNTVSTKQQDSHNPPSTSLLHGEYNEEESASSFAEALNEWRRAGGSSSAQTSVKLPQRSCSATATQARAPSRKDDVKVLFSQSSSSLSYLDRIIMKKYKKSQQELISAKLPSPTQSRQGNTTVRSSKSVSPVQSVTNANSPSPCLLSIHATPSFREEKTTKPTSTVVDVRPCDENDDYLPAAIVNPIISYDGSDNETPLVTTKISTTSIQKSNYRYDKSREDVNRKTPSSKTDLPYIVTQGKISNVNTISNSGLNNKVITPPPLTQNINDVNIVKNHANDVDTRWRVQPTHTNMDQFFLIGGGNERDVDAKDSGVDVTNPQMTANENNVTTAHYSGGVWQPDSSLIPKGGEHLTQETDINEMKSPHIEISSPQASKTSSLPDYQFVDSLDADPQNGNHISYLKTGDVSIDDCLNIYSDDDELYLAADRLMAASPKPKAIYDFIEAMPPLCKGDNHDKLHRSSTSLSISAFPVDVWADSDASLPVSRRSSNLCNSVSNSRKTSSNYESLLGHNNNAETSTMLNFNKLNLLAEEVIARRSEESCGANSGEDNPEDNLNQSYVIRTASANGFRGEDDVDIEDNDAGSGLTTSEESDG